MAHDVFVSHSTRDGRDKTIAHAICARLEERRIRCWIAPRDIQPGSTWAEAIIDAVARSRVMVLVFSALANASPHVMREVERAVSKGIPIVPFRIDDVVPSKAMEYFISSSHWLDALTPPIEAHIAQLAETVAFLTDGDRSRAPESGAASRTEPPSRVADRGLDPGRLRRIFEEFGHDPDWLKAGKAMCREGRLDQAVKLYQATAKSAERMAAAAPNGSSYQNWFFVHYHLAHVLSVLGDVSGALEEYRNSRDIAERAKAHPEIGATYANFRANSVSTHTSSGELLLRTGDHDAALREYRSGLALAEAHLAHHPDDFFSFDQIWWINVTIGDLLAARGSAGALAAYRAALGLIGPMQERWPNTSDWQRKATEVQHRISRLEAAPAG